ncbi:hypothetical protein K491DRAFT_683120 [Lophiostoma macrostomum CBS 122681]|uniref:Uncharacterized protein n=1 Tax=Lophiostoma macrostomum CBS 122681 TaxID=1314788 RepID=A0A6A6SVQ3_9PLEO|nr:hypothetical protein K491DRAFT_683120 [Lophiostoma macrostomum CBS 122681]
MAATWRHDRGRVSNSPGGEGAARSGDLDTHEQSCMLLVGAPKGGRAALPGRETPNAGFPSLCTHGFQKPGTGGPQQCRRPQRLFRQRGNRTRSTKTQCSWRNDKLHTATRELPSGLPPSTLLGRMGLEQSFAVARVMARAHPLPPSVYRDDTANTTILSSYLEIFRASETSQKRPLNNKEWKKLPGDHSTQGTKWGSGRRNARAGAVVDEDVTRDGKAAGRVDAGLHRWPEGRLSDLRLLSMGAVPAASPAERGDGSRGRREERSADPGEDGCEDRMVIDASG